ncbi:MAG: methyl-accepting chemotaxis protein [Cyanobacteria bacterium P01_G01_bin.67]
MSDNSGDIVNKIVEANALENSGDAEAAIALYQEILELDRGGNYGDVAQQALDNLQQATDNISRINLESSQEKSGSWWSRLSIKAKTSFILIGVAITSSIGISTVAYILADKTISQQINRIELKESSDVTKEIALFMRQRYGDIKIMAKIGEIADPELRTKTNSLQKRAALRSYVNSYGIYSSVTAFDLKGNAIAHSGKETVSNPQESSYFQETINFDQPLISQPIVTESSNTSEIYFSAPIKDTRSAQTIGIMVARMPVAVIDNIVDSSESYQTSYLLDNQGEVFWSSNGNNNLNPAAISNLDYGSQLKSELSRRRNNQAIRSDNNRQARELNSIFTGKSEIAYLSTFGDLDAKLIRDLPYVGWSTVRAVDKNYIFAPQKQMSQVFILGNILAVLVVAALSRLIAERATHSIVEAAAAVEQMGQGNLKVRLPVAGDDELADLSRNINKMAGQIEDLLFTQEAEAKQQRQEKELLQQGVMGLLLDVEGAQKGDLTVRAQMTDGVVGSIADAFNATMKKLRGLLQEVQIVSSEVGQLSLTGEDSVRQLSESAISQTQEITQALGSIDEINQSVKTVANYAQEAAKIARHGSIQAREGDLAMDATVNSIEKIRDTVANTSKKVKQLAESSQEIAQIVEIISGISEKTNLLAFNASVEAARAGEHGEGFRIVAEEVRRLADRITGATKDIQQLVTTIQQDTTSVLQGMETSTSEVVNGSELVRMTKLNLRTLAETSKQIDEYLKYISTSTIDQTNTSQVVNQKISGIATVAQSNSTEAQQVVESLKTLVLEADNLQSSISQFKLEV